jgi:hypothetical protein
MESARDKNLASLYASSYFSGTFARALAQERQYANPEEIFVAGLLYRLPWLALANSYPDDFKEMEDLIRDDNSRTDEACRNVFGVDYDDLCSGLAEFYNLPESVLEVVSDTSSNNPIVSLVHESGQIASMLFGTRMGGKKAMASVEKRIRDILNSETFDIAEFIKVTCVNDQNISRFFNMDTDDVAMMVNALKWGKGNPAEITAGLQPRHTAEEALEKDDPEVLIGHFITELMMCSRKGTDINQVLMLAQEAIFRCLPSSELFACFLNRNKTALVGRFYAGSDHTIRPDLFEVALRNRQSTIVQALLNKHSGWWHAENGDVLGIPQISDALHLQAAIYTPICVRQQPIGMYFVGRSRERPDFDEREQAWLDHITGFVATCFQKQQR